MKYIRENFRDPDPRGKNRAAVFLVEDDTLPAAFRVTLARGQALQGSRIAPALGPGVMMRLLYSGNREVFGLKNCGSRPWRAAEAGCAVLVEPGTVLVLSGTRGLVVTFPEIPGVRVRFLGFVSRTS